MQCWMVHSGTKANRIADLESLMELKKTAYTSLAAGLEPQWQEMSLVMRRSEFQLK